MRNSYYNKTMNLQKPIKISRINLTLGVLFFLGFAYRLYFELTDSMPGINQGMKSANFLITLFIGAIAGLFFLSYFTKYKSYFLFRFILILFFLFFLISTPAFYSFSILLILAILLLILGVILKKKSFIFMAISIGVAMAIFLIGVITSIFLTRY